MKLKLDNEGKPLIYINLNPRLNYLDKVIVYQELEQKINRLTKEGKTKLLNLIQEIKEMITL